MKKRWIISIPPLVVSIVLVSVLAIQNDVASDNKHDKGYLSFNWNKPDISHTIMNYWRADFSKSNAIKKNCLRGLYIPDFFFTLKYRAVKEQLPWFTYPKRDSFVFRCSSNHHTFHST